jgi:class 3 adenylate cyclase
VELNKTRRVKLSIFYSDIIDFSAHSANMEGEALSIILNSYLCAMTDIVNHFKGTLDKYIGDAIMVFLAIRILPTTQIMPFAVCKWR